MNKFGEYLSVKIGIIISVMSSGLNVVSVTSTVIFAVSLMVSGILWCMVWDWDKNISISKNGVLYGIHVLATSLTPFIIAVIEPNQSTWGG